MSSVQTLEDVRANARARLDLLRAEQETSTPSDAVPAITSIGSSAAATSPWPTPLRDPAYHGAVGELVRAIEPHTEADPVAVLMQILVMFGNVIGRTAHFCVEVGEVHDDATRTAGAELPAAHVENRNGGLW